ncbi:YidC/Oxa1 family membrane protein insertase [Caldicellulosiruptoraceae bacterium PP1]
MTPTWLDFLAIPLGRLLKFIYDALHAIHLPGSYGISIIILTLLVRFILMPLFIRQIQSTSKMAEVAPRLQEIQKKYKNDQRKLQEEMMKLYQETGYNPAGGCWPMLIQLPVFMALYYVFQNPLVYVVGKTHQYVNTLVHGLTGYNITNTIIAEAQKYIDMSFFGLNLARKETIILPILNALSSYFYAVYSQKSQQKFNPTANQMSNQMLSSMNLVFPVMSWFIALQVPAGLIIYWITTNLFSMFQQYVVNTLVYSKLHKKEEVAIKNQETVEEQKDEEEQESNENEENENVEEEKENEEKKEEERRKELEKLRQQLQRGSGKKKK